MPFDRLAHETGLFQYGVMLGLIRPAALHAEDNITRSLLADDFYNSRPINYAVAAGTTDWRTGHLATFSFGMLHRDVPLNQ